VCVCVCVRACVCARVGVRLRVRRTSKIAHMHVSKLTREGKAC